MNQPKKTKPKVGDLVEVMYHELDGMNKDTLKNGGEVIYTVGYLIGYDSNLILISSELDVEKEPFRDINLIPRGVVKNIEVIRQGNFKKWLKL
jgi:hypothetical protein